MAGPRPHAGVDAGSAAGALDRGPDPNADDPKRNPRPSPSPNPKTKPNAALAERKEANTKVGEDDPVYRSIILEECTRTCKTAKCRSTGQAQRVYDKYGFFPDDARERYTDLGEEDRKQWMKEEGISTENIFYLLDKTQIIDCFDKCERKCEDGSPSKERVRA